MFSPADRKEIAEIKQSIHILDEKLSLYPQLVEMNSTLKLLVTEVSKLVGEQDAEILEKFGEVKNRLEGLGASS